MSSHNSVLGVRRPRSRRSIAHIPTSKTIPGADKANITTDLGSIPASGNDVRSISKDKKSRSKSLGPSGLDVLQDTTGNRRKVSEIFRAWKRCHIDI